MRALGKTTVKVKKGSSLRSADELKILKAAAQAGRMAGVDVVPAFLGGHAVPPEFEGRPDAYVDLVAEGMIDAGAEEGLPRLFGFLRGRGVFHRGPRARVLRPAEYG